VTATTQEPEKIGRMTSWRDAIRPVVALRDLRRSLKSRPGHFQGLVSGFARSAARLAATRARLKLVGRDLVVIGLAERMGDIVACEPVARKVREAHPDAHVLWATRPSYAELVRHHPQIDGVLPIHCITEWIWLKRLAPFDRAFDLHVNGKSCDKCRRELVKSGPGSEVTVETYYDHGSLLGAFSKSAGLPIEGEAPALHVDRATREAVDRLGLPDRFVAIHTLSDEDCRNWDAAKWRRLVDHLIGSEGFGVVEVGLRSTLGRPDGGGYVNLSGQVNILESAEVIRRASLFVGVDSGPAHLANAAGTPGVILLGDYRSFRSYLPFSGPYADPARGRLVRHDGPAADLPFEACLSAVVEMAPPRVEAVGPSGGGLSQR
jgi:ADP-heptose:LPS heptosyltransferase